MIGGTVVDVWRWQSTIVEVAVEENGKFLGIHLEKNENSLAISRGDIIWWQSRWALWTTKDRSIIDRLLPRVGYSYHLEGGVTLGRALHPGPDSEAR